MDPDRPSLLEEWPLYTRVACLDEACPEPIMVPVTFRAAPDPCGKCVLIHVQPDPDLFEVAITAHVTECHPDGVEVPDWAGEEDEHD